MSKRARNPILLIGLGAFGRAVLDFAAGSDEEPSNTAGPPAEMRNLQALWVETDRAKVADPAALVATLLADAKARCRKLLDLKHFVRSTAHTDVRGPRLDVFMIADLSEGVAADVVSDITATLSKELRREFGAILRVGHGALAVCPILFVPGAADRGAAATVVRSLGELSRAPEVERPQARVYIVEDQSGKYLLSRKDMEHSFAAFLHLLLFSDARHDSGEELVEELADGDVAPFATFACATFEVDMPGFRRLCAIKLARELLKEFQAGAGPDVEEIATGAHPLVPDEGVVRPELEADGAVRVHDRLEPPTMHVPTVADTDEPEAIMTNFGAVWQAGEETKLAHYRDNVERNLMKELAVKIETNGCAILNEFEKNVAETIERIVEAGPRGHSKALAFLDRAIRDARQRAKDAKELLDPPGLSKFPKPPMDIEPIVEAANLRPRGVPPRMRVFGTVLAAVCTVLLGVALKALPYPASEFKWELWVPWVMGALISCGGIYYFLRSHLKRHRDELNRRRDAFDQDIRTYLRVKVLGYFHRRLDFTVALWMYRIYTQVTERLEAYSAQLLAIRAALEEAERQLEIQERDRLQALGSAASTGGILFRGLFSSDIVDAVYAHEHPGGTPGLAREYFSKLVDDADHPVLEGTFADARRLADFCMGPLKHIETRSPFRQDGGPLSDVVKVGVGEFLLQLSTKLATPLELVESYAFGGRPERRLAILPPDAKKLVNDTAIDTLGGWDIRARSDNPCHIHLVLERAELPQQAIRLASAAPSAAKTVPSAAAPEVSS